MKDGTKSYKGNGSKILGGTIPKKLRVRKKMRGKDYAEGVYCDIYGKLYSFISFD